MSDLQPGRLDALFVQSGAAFSSAEGTITLHDPSAATVFFAEHPRREAGHVPTRRFIELWAAGRDGFAGGEPTAVISFVEADDGSGGPPDAVVVLREPRMDGATLTYAVELVEGALPAEAGPCALFIDTLDQPLSPVLGAPVRRVRRKR